MSGPDFWSRRRAAVEAEEAADAKAKADAEVAAKRKDLEQRSDQEILEELNLPDPDEMRPGDDFSAFLRAAVPRRIQRRALRVLWSSNPVLANLDGLVEYGEDFTDAATVIEDLMTTYQVGKGMTRHVEEMLRQAAEKEERAERTGDEPEELEVPDPDLREMPEEIAQDDPPLVLAESDASTGENLDNPEDNSRKPGRMRYHFDSD